MVKEYRPISNPFPSDWELKLEKMVDLWMDYFESGKFLNHTIEHWLKNLKRFLIEINNEIGFAPPLNDYVLLEKLDRLKQIYRDCTEDNEYYLISIYELIYKISLNNSSGQSIPQNKLFNEAKDQNLQYFALQRAIKRLLKDGIIIQETNNQIRLLPKLKKKVFICYSSLDLANYNIEKIVKRLKRFHQIERVYFWITDAKDNFDFMTDAITNADIMIFFNPTSTPMSQPQKWELSSYHATSKRIIPIFKDVNNLHPLIRTKRGLKYEPIDFDGFIKKLYKLIEAEYIFAPNLQELIG